MKKLENFQKILSDKELENQLMIITHFNDLELYFDFIEYYYVNSYFYKDESILDLMFDGNKKDNRTYTLYINRFVYLEIKEFIKNNSKYINDNNIHAFIEDIFSEKIGYYINVRINSENDRLSTEKHYGKKRYY